VNARDISCKTPLDYALFGQHGDVAELLRRHGG
jgi:ankyrin repeat protein